MPIAKTEVALQCFRNCTAEKLRCNIRFSKGQFKGTPRTPVRQRFLPDFRANFLVRFASKPLFCWAVASNCSENCFFLHCSCDSLALGCFLALDFLQCRMSVMFTKNGHKFGESLGGSQAPTSFWKAPGRLLREFPELPWKLSGDFPVRVSHCGISLYPCVS